MEPQEYDEMLRTLVRIAAKQDMINDDQRAMNARLEHFIGQQVEINQRLEVTQARIETLLARMIERSANGRDA